VAIHNLGAAPREISLEVKAGFGQSCDLVNLLTEDHSHADGSGKHRILLEPYGYRWHRVGGLDYLLKRSEI
jgi:maltose alpha-D-glucosyltransferase/alpha-amylase